jgi:acyl-CoA thioesterase-1
MKSIVRLGSLALLVLGPACSEPPQARGHKKVLVLGDSLTEGAGLAPEKVFPAKLEALIRSKGFPKVTVTADGVHGATSDTGPGRLEARLSGGEKYDILVLALGANDGLRGMDLPSLRGNLKRAGDLAEGRGMKVVLAGMRIPPHNGLAYMGEFKDLFSSLAKEEEWPLIPFLLDGVAGQPRLNLDGIHPNEAGHEKVAETVFKALKPLL